MKLLCLHSDFLEFEPVSKALKEAEEIERIKKRFEECLVCFACAEKGDEKNIDEKAAGAVSEIENIANQIKVRRIVLYPFVHLSSTPASPMQALLVLKKTEELLKAKGYETSRAPFGWYKKFVISCKGHPLAEWSREVKTGVEAKKPEFKKVHGEPDIQKEAKEERAHIGIGKQQDIFINLEQSPAMPFFPPAGTIVRNELINFMRELNRENGYEEVSTPQVYKLDMWRESGHLEAYSDRMYFLEKEGVEYGLKPMNCPGHVLLFKRKAWSYRDLPVRYSEFGTVFRHEQSGEVCGLLRVRELMQDDAHVFLKEEQTEEEVSKLLDLVKKVYVDVFGFPAIKYTLSTRSSEKEKFIGSTETWEKATNALKKALENKGLKYEEKSGEAAFYGPKIDIDVLDSVGAYWQGPTIQVDFNMPERFKLEYDDGKGGKKRPVMIHRAIFGAVERFMGMLLEQNRGRFPLWLSPVQVAVLAITDGQENYAKKVSAELEMQKIRVETDISSETLGKKIVNAHAKKIPYMIVVGEKEEKAAKVAVRDWDNKQKSDVKLSDFAAHLKDEIERKKMLPAFCKG